jgi:hypothetical protein
VELVVELKECRSVCVEVRVIDVVVVECGDERERFLDG